MGMGEEKEKMKLTIHQILTPPNEIAAPIRSKML